MIGQSIIVEKRQCRVQDNERQVLEEVAGQSDSGERAARGENGSQWLGLLI